MTMKSSWLAWQWVACALILMHLAAVPVDGTPWAGWEKTEEEMTLEHEGRECEKDLHETRETMLNNRNNPESMRVQNLVSNRCNEITNRLEEIATSRLSEIAADNTSPITDESATIRVTNLSEDTRESDLQELFEPFGNIQRIFLAKDKVTGQSKGFAFINFYNKKDAATAIANVSGFGYDHLILNVEWAKPSTQN